MDRKGKIQLLKDLDAGHESAQKIIDAMNTTYKYIIDHQPDGSRKSICTKNGEPINFGYMAINSSSLSRFILIVDGEIRGDTGA